jgi:hypothetical protein
MRRIFPTACRSTGPDASEYTRTRSDGAHRIDKLPSRAGRRRGRAHFVKTTPVFQLAGSIVAKEIGRANRSIRPLHHLRLVMKIGEREFMRLCKSLHIAERILGIVRGFVRANRRKADALSHEQTRISDKPVNHCFDIRAVIADKDNHRAVFTSYIV